MIHELVAALETQPIEAFSALVRRRLEQLGVCLVDGRVVARAESDALALEVLAVARRALGELVEHPGDALRLLDAVRATGFDQLEAERPRLERERAERHPPPPAVTWRELAELRVLAERHPELCRIGPPASHVELGCRHLSASAGAICAGEALRVRDGRVILFDRVKRHPTMMLVEQPGVSIAQALGTWWLVLEDERAPTTRRPLDLQGFLRFALRRVEAPSLEALLTDLAWRRFFT